MNPRTVPPLLLGKEYGINKISLQSLSLNVTDASFILLVIQYKGIFVFLICLLGIEVSLSGFVRGCEQWPKTDSYSKEPRMPPSNCVQAAELQEAPLAQAKAAAAQVKTKPVVNPAR